MIGWLVGRKGFLVGGEGEGEGERLDGALCGVCKLDMIQEKS